jgi:hypothetical protein
VLGGFGHEAVAEIKLRQGDLRGAVEAAEAACEGVRGYPCWSWQVTALRVRILLEQGRAAEALEVGEAALRELERLGARGFGEVELRLSVAEARWAMEQRDAARDALGRALRRLRQRVDDIPDATARERFLAKVPAHVRLLALSREWLGNDGGSGLGG